MHGSPFPEEALLFAALWFLTLLVGVAGGVTCLLLGAFRPDVQIPRLRRALALTNLIISGLTILCLVIMGLFDPGVFVFCTASLIIGGLLGVAGPPTIIDPPED